MTIAGSATSGNGGKAIGTVSGTITVNGGLAGSALNTSQGTVLAGETLVVNGLAVGGNGGAVNLTSGAGTGGNGGGATSSSTSISAGGGDVTVTDMAVGGNGGNSANGKGGDGAMSYSNVTNSTVFSATPDASAYTFSSTAIGGNGGQGSGVGFTGGYGCCASAQVIAQAFGVAASNTGTWNVSASETVGDGGKGVNGANGGGGDFVVMTSDIGDPGASIIVDGGTTGMLNLTQYAKGGAGGNVDGTGGTVGISGDAVSRLEGENPGGGKPDGDEHRHRWQGR